MHKTHIDLIRLQPKEIPVLWKNPTMTQMLLTVRCAIANFWKRTDPLEVVARKNKSMENPFLRENKKK